MGQCILNTKTPGYEIWKSTALKLLPKLSRPMASMFAPTDDRGGIMGEQGVQMPPDTLPSLWNDAGLIRSIALQDNPGQIVEMPLVTPPTNFDSGKLRGDSPFSESDVFDAAVAAVAASKMGAITERQAAILCAVVGALFRDHN